VKLLRFSLAAFCILASAVVAFAGSAFQVFAETLTDRAEPLDLAGIRRQATGDRLDQVSVYRQRRDARRASRRFSDLMIASGAASIRAAA
jgi:hypothetical protein